MKRTVLTLLAALALLAAFATPALAAPQFIETQTDNPVTAEPPVSRPAGPHCTVTLADHFMSNAPDRTPQTFSGTLAPPSACRGPWAKVVMDYTVSVSGRQYDRIGDLNIGGTEVWWGTTEEPSGPTPITYTVSKDVTEYTALLRSSQPFTGGIGNYVTDVYTGNYDQTVTLTYYQGRAPADTPDAVVGFPGQELTSSTNVAHLSLSNLPRNITRAYLEVTLEGHGCDEQWFSDVPADIAAKYPSAGMCTHGAYREADASLDGTPVAAVHTFPHIYTGGIVPTLWRPIPAIHTFSLYAEQVDVTPFVGRLVDGGTHDLAFTVQNNGDSWSVVATLLLYTDHHAAQTHGALTTDTVAPSATEHVTETPIADNGTRIVNTTSRNDVTAGYVDTSSGRVYTRVVRTVAYRNDDTVTANGLAQHIVQHDSGTQTSTVDGHVAARHAYDYPITIDYSAAAYVDDQNFSLTGTVDMTQTLVDSKQGASTENVHSYGILSRVNGVNTESDGNSTSFYARPGYVHYLASNHGLITKDVSH
ncbi:MAG TPA: peptide-N4-asparagine amidase [Jatrophihabitantaceae bacterium]|nr:peptide-N4-asparagine amidase [Jatrophihabitantaceae bacterium]